MGMRRRKMERIGGKEELDSLFRKEHDQDRHFLGVHTLSLCRTKKFTCRNVV